MRGNAIMFLRGVTAHDDFGREIEVKVDTGTVDQNTAGEYTVIYRAEDYSGLYTEVEVTVHVLDIDPDYVNERIDAALADILNDDMTQVEEARAIHTWIRRNMSYSGTLGGLQSIYELAYNALRDRRGNCYNYYALAELMLTRAGIPNMRIERIPGTGTAHFWNLINPDGLGWHHFDSLPMYSGIGVNSLMYMFTETQAQRFAQLIASRHGASTYFTYDPDLYPEIVQ
jgi:transglutaminase-like putative cysteine protease